jgi:hypothetical protein
MIPSSCSINHDQGRIQEFKLGGRAHLKKLRRAEGGAKIVGVFRVKNHDVETVTTTRVNVLDVLDTRDNSINTWKSFRFYLNMMSL